jgi:DNA-binding MarR family transcriptional regulator
LKDMKGGPFTQVFGGPVARVLDQARIVGNMEQTVSMLAESTGLTFKTVQKAITKLVKYGFVKRSRKISNAQTYRFDVESDLHELLAWADHVNLEQIRREKL